MPRPPRKPSLFIGSSTEALSVAYALQENLDSELEVTVWKQGVFGIGKTNIERLMEKIGEFDFAAFVFAPDDKALIRGAKSKKVRDNTLFEFGLFSGRLGTARTFIVAPSDEPRLRLPSDISGLIWAPYAAHRGDKNFTAALGPASNQILRQVEEVSAGFAKVPTLPQMGFFEDFVNVFPTLFQKAQTLNVYFIHSRRWRENHDERIRAFLRRKSTRLSVFLPNPRNRVLIQAIVAHFDDGPHIPEFIKDAIRYFRGLWREFPGAVEVFYYNTYPAYSFYKFDDEIVVAMYPTTRAKRSVPTFKVNIQHPFGSFVVEDLTQLRTYSRSDSQAKLSKRRAVRSPRKRSSNV